MSSTGLEETHVSPPFHVNHFHFKSITYFKGLCADRVACTQVNISFTCDHLSPIIAAANVCNSLRVILAIPVNSLASTI